MKTKSIAFTSLILIAFIALTSMKTLQDQSTFEGKYDGRQEYSYSFTGIDTRGSEYSMTFQNIENDVLKAFDLNSSTTKGIEFKVTYTTKVEVVKNDKGLEKEMETYTIVALEKL